MALGEVKSYAARQQGAVTYLDLKSAGGRVVMVLRRHNMDFLNGAWRITMLNGTPMEEGGSITIDVTDLKIHGNTGCNIFNGTLFIDPDKVDSAQFADLITTRMSCPDKVRETRCSWPLSRWRAPGRRAPTWWRCSTPRATCSSPSSASISTTTNNPSIFTKVNAKKSGVPDDRRAACSNCRRDVCAASGAQYVLCSKR